MKKADEKKVNALIERAQRREDALLERRKMRVMAMLRKFGPDLLDFEVRQIENALAPALGRITLEG